jgi:predicted acyltransferase
MKAPRLLSLDVLRGATVALMILVNNAGGVSISYGELRHSAWNGCSVADVVFPMFLFIVGASIAIALPRRLDRGDTPVKVFVQVFKRAALIAAIGLVLNALPMLQIGELRYYGVLQRIALCYLLASFVYLYGQAPACAGAVVIALVGYWLLLYGVPVPGYGLPGIDVLPLDPHGNLTAWLDRRLVPAAHLYHQGFYDPEGLLSTLPAVATTLFGTLSVVWLRQISPWVSMNGMDTDRRKALWLLICGVLLLWLGLEWGQSFPLNKRLWTSSFVLFNAGLDMVLLAVLYWGIDCRRELGPRLQKSLTPWLAFGSNALTAYVFSEVLAMALSAIPVRHEETLQEWLFRSIPAGLGSPAFLSLVYSLLFVALCFVPVLMLYRRKIFIKL